MSGFDDILEESEKSGYHLFFGLADSFARSVFSCLKNKNISQKELARRLGKTEAYVSKLLSGSQNVTLKTIAETANALECNVKEIVFYDSEKEYSSINDCLNITNSFSIACPSLIPENLNTIFKQKFLHENRAFIIKVLDVDNERLNKCQTI